MWVILRACVHVRDWERGFIMASKLWNKCIHGSFVLSFRLFFIISVKSFLLVTDGDVDFSISFSVCNFVCVRACVCVCVMTHYH